MSLPGQLVYLHLVSYCLSHDLRESLPSIKMYRYCVDANMLFHVFRGFFFFARSHNFSKTKRYAKL